jgi:formylmethanofuran dehydrogenase subunit C
MIGFNMTGGTVLVRGSAGIRPGAGMHGGTIAIFGPKPPPVLSSFRLDRTAEPEKLASILAKFPGDTARLFEAALLKAAAVYIGDQIVDGTGELYLQTAPPN